MQHKANQGNETALAILRSIQEIPEPDREPQTTAFKDWSQHGKEQFAANRSQVQAEYAGREVAALENEKISGTAKKQLLAILRMERLATEEAAHVQGFSTIVDSKGTVIFTLPSGGRILDSGTELFFSGNDDAARHVAIRYAQKK